jgi:hypothetical protein
VAKAPNLKVGAFLFAMEETMAEKKSSEPLAEKVFDNLIFIAEVFADREEEEIPDVPLLELARCFELSRFGPKRSLAKEVNGECAIESHKQAVG